MNILAKAIKNKADASTGLMNLVSNDFYYFKAADGATIPYCTFNPVNQNPLESFDDSVDNNLWQINVFSNTATNAGEILSEIKNVFDNTELVLESGQALNCSRQNANIRELEDIERFQGYVEYRIYTE